jgi:hypothetical protein
MRRVTTRGRGSRGLATGGTPGVGGEVIRDDDRSAASTGRHRTDLPHGADPERRPMTEVAPWEYAAVFALTTAITAFLTPMALRLAVRQAILDRPNAIKAQAAPVPYLGGMAVLVTFSLVLLRWRRSIPPSAPSASSR